MALEAARGQVKVVGNPSRALDVILHDFGEDLAEGCVGAHYLGDPASGVSGVAIDPKAPKGIRGCYRLQAEGYHRRRIPKGGRSTMFHSSRPEDLDRNAVLAIRCVVEDVAPEWVAEVREAARMSNDSRVIAAFCEISVAVVVAILEILDARGELPADEEGAA